MKSKNKKIKSSKAKDHLEALNFLTEAGLLKRVKRSGWWVAGIKDPESVAEHSFRCAVIGYYLAHLEEVNPYKVLVMTLFNDIHEARINDLHKMGHLYIDFKEAEKKVFREQTRFLSPQIKSELVQCRRELNDQKTRESLIARDADILECLLQAKEYLDNGYKGAKKFLEKAPDFLKTTHAKALWNQMRRWHSNSWWEDIVKFER